MTDYAADRSGIFTGTVTTKRTGTSSADTVPINSTILAVNGGAGSHVLTFTVHASVEGLTVPNNPVTVAAGTAVLVKVPGDVGDANGRVALAIDGTATEVTYYVVGFG